MKAYFLIFGLALGLVLFLIQVIKHHVLIQELEIEIFGLVLVSISIPIGIWLGRSLIKTRKQKNIKASIGGSMLSQREIEVLELIASGNSNQEIADTLFVSVNTTKTHISSIYTKLGVQRRTQAVQKAIEIGILSQNSV